MEQVVGDLKEVYLVLRLECGAMRAVQLDGEIAVEDLFSFGGLSFNRHREVDFITSIS